MDGSIANPRPMLALGLRLATAGTLATMSMLVKLGGERGVNLAELVFWRQAVTLLCVISLLVLWGKLATVKTVRFAAHARRAIYGLAGMFFVYGAVMLLPLPEATAIGFTAPFFAVLLSVVLFGESVGKYRWGAVVLGFAGVLILTQPGSGVIDPIGAAIGLFAAFLVALISFQIQDLNKTESPWSIIFWFTLMTTPLAALALPFVFEPHDLETWGVIVAMALCGALAQILLTSSLRFGSAGVILLMDYTAILWATYYGSTIFGQTPPTTLWLGAPLIIGAGLLIAYRERLLAREKTGSAGQS
ncbi:MAG: DMT family transporter [Erythrobacter sp.]|nr:DMT family transporter [Erythrobacter sp.]